MLRGSAVLLACVVMVGPVAAQKGEKVKYPRLHSALHELREAKNDLKISKRAFGGKKEKAIEAIDAAIVSLKKCLDIKGDDYKGIDRDRDRAKKFKDHPHVRMAIEDLRDARRELNDAPDKFKGHKKQAIKDIDHAIDVLQDILK
jgi:hypothetical protein